MFYFFDDYLQDILQSFLDPRKRVFLGYLLCAALLGMLYWVWVKKSSCISSLKHLFSKRVWWSRSAQSDYLIFFINPLVMKLISPALLSQLTLATLIFYGLYEAFPSRPAMLANWSDTAVSLVFTLCYFLLDDFARFYVHRLMHRWPLLWNFHKVHHSAQRLTPITVFRTHPVEAIIFSIRSAVTQGLAIGTLIFFLGERADVVTVLGANLFVFCFNILGSNLRHSHVHIRFWSRAEKIVISPAQHQIHHSIEERHWDKNFGVALSIWDRFFGSFHHSEAAAPKAFGLQGDRDHSLAALYWKPFIESFELSRIYTRKCAKKASRVFSLPNRNVSYETSKKSL